MLMLIMRLLHVTFGAFWVGAIFFVVLFLEPSVRQAGPNGAPVMRGIMQRRYLDVIPAVALVTLLSGLWLVWRDSAGFQSEWFSSPFGMTLSIGMTAAIVAFAIGVSVMRPAAMQMGQKAMAMQQATDDTQRGTLVTEMGNLQARVRAAGRWVASLLLIAVVTMAIARYV